MQPLDANLFAGSSAPVSSQPTPDTDDGAIFPKGTDVWYIHRSGAWQPAIVTAVDETMGPAFYQVRSSQEVDEGVCAEHCSL